MVNLQPPPTNTKGDLQAYMHVYQKARYMYLWYVSADIRSKRSEL